MKRKDFLLLGSKTALFSILGMPTTLASFVDTRNTILSTPQEDPLAKDIEQLIPQLLAQSKVPGMSIAIIRNGKLSWSKGFGITDQSSKKRVNADTIFEAASVSKTVFAYAVMKLCENGTLNLDTPLVKYSSKRFLENDTRSDKITARHVLSHQTGFQNWRTPEEPLKIYFNPGTNFNYSGEGYFYLQSIITELKGKTYPDQCGSFEAGLKVCATDIGDYLKKQVLLPNEMNSSGYIWTDTIAKNAALPHDPEGKLISRHPQNATDMARYASAGGLLTSVKDYANFLTGLFTPKENDQFLLNKKSLDEMFRPQVKLPEDQKIDGASSWALGWAVQERVNGNVVLHSGGQPGFRSLAMVSIPKKSGFVMLSNGDGGGNVLYNQQLGNLLNTVFV